MDPITIMMVAGTTMQFLGSQKQGQAAKAAGEANYQYLKQSAEVTRKLGVEDERRFRVEAKKFIGKQHASIGASGIQTDGSALEVLRESAATSELDALTVKFQSDYKAWQLEREGAIAKMQGEAQANASGMAGLGGLLSGIGNIAGGS